MRELIIQIFGVYTPVTDEAGVIASGMAGVDWVYIGGVFLFAVVLISFFKMIGGLLKR